MSYLNIKNLQLYFKSLEGEKKTLDIKKLEVEKNKTYGLVGESGAGKTVLAYTIFKLLQMPPGFIKSGEITLNGEDILSKSEKEMEKVRGKKMAMVFQDPMSTLNPVFTIGSQLTRVIRQNKGVSKKEAHDLAIDMIDKVKLPDSQSIMNKYPHQLSGGQRQRVIIALALACGAEFLVVDEPTRNLDVTIQAGILKLIGDIQKQLSVTVLFIANNLELVSLICDRVGIIYEGTIIEEGDIREIIFNSKHPYTKVLLNPNLDKSIIKGDINKVQSEVLCPSSEKGCVYYSKCISKNEKCYDYIMEEKVIPNSNHMTTCLLHQKGEL